MSGQNIRGVVFDADGVLFDTERLGRLPKAGEHPQVKEAGLTITVLEVEEQRIARLLLVKDAQEEPTGKEESERK